MISWLGSGDGWGTREQAIPGEWALLVLLIMLGAVLGLLVLWFTLLRHERAVRRRARRRNELMLTEIGAAADEPVPVPAEDQEQAEPAGPAEPAAEEPEPEAAEGAPEPTGSARQRKLTDEILSRVEAELAERDTPRWRDLAALVHHEFGVTVHPSSIQKAVRRRRLAQATQTT
ncbi:hypothetical protein [Actinospica sp.]|uniref:hypothetical protein n=1 Tax=Actinospica sp. TaxID=1872142 RepID=UPI002CB4972C|nr:hypothetical protein [Actinospica sp.]HWG27769.1 hypothetical protein [Actinospica sp.]